MTLEDVIDNWSDLSVNRKKAALSAINTFLLERDWDEFDEEVALQLIVTACDFEDEDYFGTEGLRI